MPKFRHCLIYTAAIALIILAVCFSLLRAILPHAHGYQVELEQQLSQQLGLPVSVGLLDASMDWFTPRLVLIDVVIYKENAQDKLIHFNEIELSLAYLDTVKYLTPMVGEINLVGGSIIVERFRDDRWLVQGIEVTRSEESMPDELRILLENANFSLSESHVLWRDHTGKYESFEAHGVHIKVENTLGDHAIEASMLLPEEYGESVRVVANFSGHLQNFSDNVEKVYLDVRSANLHAWQQGLHLDVPYQLKGMHDLQLWLELEKQQLTGVTAKLESNNIALHIGKQTQAAWSADSFFIEALWQRRTEGWHAYVQQFSYVNDKAAWSQPANASIRTVPGGLHGSIDYLHVGELHKLLTIAFDENPPDWLQRMAELKPQGEIYNLLFEYSADNWRDTAISFTAQDMAIDLESLFPEQPVSLQGLATQFFYDGKQASFTLLSDNAQLQLPKMFRYPITLQSLNAVASFSWYAGGWQLNTDLLHVSNQHVTADARMAIIRQAENTYVDIQTAYRDADGTAAHQYYPVSELDPDLIAWLDAAITDGVIEEGGFMMYGNAADFPFKQDGVMQAEFKVQDMNLLFESDWPKLKALQANVLFDNVSMRIDQATAKTFNSELVSAVVTIDDLYNSVLNAKGKIKAPMSDIQRYIWASPLDKTLGNAMNQIQASGNSVVDIAVTVPLENDDAMSTKGQVALLNSKITYPDLAYQLDDVTGVLHFTDSDIWSESMRARMDGRALDIFIGDHRSLADTIAIELTGTLSINSLLTRFSWIPDNWFAGSSDWHVSINIPQSEHANHVDIAASSDLKDVTMGISDVLSKSAEMTYPFNLNARVENGLMQLIATLPGDMSLIAVRDTVGEWDVFADTSLIKGKIGFNESFAADTRITMRLEHLHLSQLMSKTGSDNVYSILPAHVPTIDGITNRLEWKNWQFGRSRLLTSQHSSGMLINELELQGRDLRITGTGGWLTGWREPHETTLDLVIHSDNFGNALSGLGYQRYIDQCEHHATMNLQWKAEPFNFSWDKVTGTATFEMKDGQVTDIDPGAGGRLLGLLNVFHLPRRLLLGFGDVYKEGFVFDSINGDFVFEDGSAETNNIEIEAAAADVRIQGRIGMQDEDYDLLLRVKPNQSAAAFTGGMLAGGAAVGAGLVLLQKLLGLEKAAQDRYHITGGWDDPVVTQIEKSDASEQTQYNDELDEEYGLDE